jgi:hypothetical protein
MFLLLVSWFVSNQGFWPPSPVSGETGWCWEIPQWAEDSTQPLESPFLVKEQERSIIYFDESILRISRLPLINGKDCMIPMYLSCNTYPSVIYFNRT